MRVMNVKERCGCDHMVDYVVISIPAHRDVYLIQYELCYPGTAILSITKTNNVHDITRLLLNVALNAHISNLNHSNPRRQ
jgi:selenophosphate synthetase-related protein